jgi:hypothetical protein
MIFSQWRTICVNGKLNLFDSHAHSVEGNNIYRSTPNTSRALASSLLPSNVYIMSLTHFPLMGVNQWSVPYSTPTPFDGYSRSLFVADNAIGLHARFRY